ncbi:STAS domain-containing protein [Streptomyces sp. NPDC006632]|uniref:STAS domain-containing protein n=1 Tax=unclassified Streptomyces TaxID=2593676 RepID=UPI002E223081
MPAPYRRTRSYFVYGITVVEIHGTIDLSTVPGIRVHIDAATAPHGAQVIVDLRPVEFLDCSALTLLCRARRRVLERDGRLALVCVRPWHLRILEVAGLRELFRPLATVQDAVGRGGWTSP